MSVQSISASQLALNPTSAVQARQATGTPDNAKVEQERSSGVAAPAEPKKANEVASTGVVDREELERALENVRRVVEPVAHNLQFIVDEDTGRTVVKVLDSATDQVIRQIPSEEILSIAKALDKLSGLLIEQKA